MLYVFTQVDTKAGDFAEETGCEYEAQSQSVLSHGTYEAHCGAVRTAAGARQGYRTFSTLVLQCYVQYLPYLIR